jgi:hypothetical protein
MALEFVFVSKQIGVNGPRLQTLDTVGKPLYNASLLSDANGYDRNLPFDLEYGRVRFAHRA